MTFRGTFRAFAGGVRGGHPLHTTTLDRAQLTILPKSLICNFTTSGVANQGGSPLPVFSSDFMRMSMVANTMADLSRPAWLLPHRHRRKTEGADDLLARHRCSHSFVRIRHGPDPKHTAGRKRSDHPRRRNLEPPSRTVSRFARAAQPTNV